MKSEGRSKKRSKEPARKVRSEKTEYNDEKRTRGAAVNQVRSEKKRTDRSGNVAARRGVDA